MYAARRQETARGQDIKQAAGIATGSFRTGNSCRSARTGLSAYRQAQNDPVQQRVLEHVDMVKRIALHLNDRLDGGAELDELIQTGFMGLLEAARRYDTSDGVPFEAFALQRVRGAMIDELRRNDWCPRTLRRHATEIRRVRERLEQRGEALTERNIAAALELDLHEYQRICSRLDSARLMSLDTLMEDRGDQLPLADDVTAEDGSLQALMRSRRAKALATAIHKLPSREQLLLSLYYEHELNQKEIARVLELTEARVCQLRKQAHNKLRVLMSEWA
ncbi:RNA polymerase sigma factor FliA [Spongorhabdus nitratireducens]